MVHKKIRIPIESANEIMRALGLLKDSIEFEDLTKDDVEARKSFSDMIKRCDEMKKKITDYSKVCYDFQYPIQNYNSYEDFSKDLRDDMQNRDKKFGSTYFDLVENEILENERKINELVDSHTQIREDLITLIEKKYVFKKAQELVRSNVNFSGISNLNFLIGVVPVENEMKMKRMLFRISRGRALTAFYSLEISSDEYKLTSKVRQRNADFIENQNTRLQKLSAMIQSKDLFTVNTKKKIFTIIFPGSEENILLSRLLQVCEIFQASRYTIPKISDVVKDINEIAKEIKDKKTLMNSIENNLQYFFYTNNAYGDKGAVKYSMYRIFFEQEKMIYTTLNKCIIRDTFVDGHVWIPLKEVGRVTAILQNLFGAEQENKTSAYLEDLPINEDDKPPTLISINEFTAAFQQVVDTYGTPRYKEVNPGYFTIVTFPFLFGVMFGDIGHGLILFIFAIYICIFNDKISKSKSLLKGILFARYFLLLMGFFAVYCGFLYNDFISVPVYIKTCYNVTDDKEKEVDLERKTDCKYRFGVDPAWYLANNELAFMNSLKMKLSVILGVFHMVIGIILKGVNAFFEGDMVELIFVFFPQIVLMLSLFGYMDFLIFAKWATDYSKQINFRDSEGSEKIFNYTILAPDIKSYLMNIFLSPGKLPDFENPFENDVKEKRLNLTDNDWYLLTDRDKLEHIHLGLLLISLLSMILMFFPKIFLNYSKEKKNYIINNGNNINGILNQGQEQNQFQEQLIPQKEIEVPNFSNIFVEVAIETIEFVLGTVSNTASYLRLWALSLAHSQLAYVAFSKTIASFGNITDNWRINGIILIAVFPIFAGATAIVLLFMDVMECFLHTLRLHWVEFQNKFYRADGYQFKAFYFQKNITLENEEFTTE